MAEKLMEMAGNGWKWLEMARNSLKGFQMAGNGWKWAEMAGMARNGCRWLDMA